MRRFLTIAVVFLCGLPAQTVDPGIVLRFDVDLVQVDAVVTDSNGRHVADLTKDDFQVLQDGKPQRVTHFSYVAAEQPGAPRPARSEVRRAVVIVIDENELKVTDFLSLQQALGKYVEQSIRPGDLVALIRTSGGSGALQQFSGDPELLRLAVRHMTWKPSVPQADRLLKPVLIRAAQALAGFPGRKSIVVISPGRVIDAGLVTGELLQDLREISDAANRASVAIDTIDIRRLAVLMPGADNGGGRGGRGGGRGGAQLGRAMRTFREGQTYLQLLSEATGGLFQSDNNDMTGQIRTAVEDAGGYYLLARSPGSNAFKTKPGADPKYHTLEVKVLRRGLVVRSRQGFFAVPGAGETARTLTPEEQTRDALFSPFRSGGLDVQLTPSVVYDGSGGATVESLLRIRSKGVEFREEADGCRTANLELLTAAVALDAPPEGKEKIAGDHVSVTVCGDTAREVMRDGLVAVMRNVVAPGHYQVRAAVRSASEIGSAAQVLEVADARKEELVIAGVSLWTGSGGPPQLIQGTSYRMVEEGDPAVRQFRPNDALKFTFQVRRGAGKQELPIQARVKLMRGDQEIYAGRQREVKSGELITGLYRLDAALEPGTYLFGVIATSGGKEFTHWLDFEIK
ncbi:MAG TPA: VWA domain-containing protein [Candidatus Sulfopaludibacter sp.]|jgi:VWFA-related protein|nr:VWA domain-containing protein [Candidatus Sulfopaludibacter sp.]